MEHQKIISFCWTLFLTFLLFQKIIIPLFFLCFKKHTNDILMIRADRESYYYGKDMLFQVHPDLIEILCKLAPKLLFVVCDGLMWQKSFLIYIYVQTFLGEHLKMRPVSKNEGGTII